MRPSNVENAHAVSMYQCKRSCGDSCTNEILCKLQTASIFGKIHVLIISASMCTATNIVVQMANATNIPGGTCVSLLIWTSTIATWKWANRISIDSSSKKDGFIPLQNRTKGLTFYWMPSIWLCSIVIYAMTDNSASVNPHQTVTLLNVSEIKQMYINRKRKLRLLF